MWMWRRMERISWRAKITNMEVRARVCESRPFINTIVKRKNNWVEHVIICNGLIKEAMEGRMFGKRGLGRPGKEMMNKLF